MKINKTNYEIFFIDFLDENLKKEDLKDFNNFLLENPYLAKELEKLKQNKPIFKAEENIKFEQKNILKKSLKIEKKIFSEENFEKFCIAKMEKDLTVKEEKEFDNYIAKNKTQNKIFSIFLSTKLIPDKNIIFNNKKNLKKTLFFSKKIFLYRLFAVASVFLLFFTLFLNFNKNKDLDIVYFDKKDAQLLEINLPKNELKLFVNNKITETTEVKNIKKTKNITKVFITEFSENQGEEEILSIDSALITDKNIQKISLNILEEEEIIFKNKDTLKEKDIHDYLLASSNYIQPIRKKQKREQKQEYTLKEYMISQLKEKILHLPEDSSFIKNDNNKINFWDIATVAVNKWNKISDKKIRLEKKKKPNGEMAITLITKKYIIKRN